MNKQFYFKFLVQLGLVLFNDGAHIAHTVGVLTDSQTRRNGIAVQVKTKFSEISVDYLRFYLVFRIC